MTPADLIVAGKAVLGIELGSTRIKACLIGEDPSHILGTGASEWVNELRDGLWTYSLDAVWVGIQEAYRVLVENVESAYGVVPKRFAALGVSAMMHGYLAFDNDDLLLVPFRTWRNTNTDVAASELSALFDLNIPHRWSVAHLYQAILDEEPHVPDIDFITSLAGYVHWRLTGEKIIGVGDASGLFPVDSSTGGYDEKLVDCFNLHVGNRLSSRSLLDLLPRPLPAGEVAGTLSPAGASLLDPTNRLESGIPLCPPEGDAGTGMVATNTVTVRTGNVSAGTSIFAMVVLDKPIKGVHPEIDLVVTPDGKDVALVHCNNGASELAAWVQLFARFCEVANISMEPDSVFETLFTEAVAGEADAGGLIAYNYLAGEPITGLVEGRPLFVRTPNSELTLANFMRSQLYGVFATLSLGMRVLERQGVTISQVFAHGGIFRTLDVAQRLLAAALAVPVAVGLAASEGGAWGIAVLASYMRNSDSSSLDDYLTHVVFRNVEVSVTTPAPSDVDGFETYLKRYESGLRLQHKAIKSI